MTDVRSFLGFTNQYRKFIPKYAHLAGPLNQLVSGDNSKKKKKEVQWTPECQEAFEKESSKESLLYYTCTCLC